MTHRVRPTCDPTCAVCGLVPLVPRLKGTTRVVARSPAMQSLLKRAARFAASDAPVVVLGETGTGKEVVARVLHANSSRSRQPFVAVNVAALPAELLESELFGHGKGSFTGASAARSGLFEAADGGTLFLDEITELPEPSQAKLLKFLDTMRFRRLGAQREIEVSLRVVAATNRDVRKIDSARFREDLYHRLAVFLVNIPPLAERRDDIAELAQGFVRYFAGRVKKRITGISADALRALSAYHFPGNVRELRNIIERAIILAEGPEISARDVILPERGGDRPQAASFFSMPLGPDGAPPPSEVVERAYVARVLEHFHGKRVIAAQALGISYPTFLKRLRELGLAHE